MEIVARPLSEEEVGQSFMSRVDFSGWAQWKDFAAMAENIARRREQMLGVYHHVVRNPSFQKDAETIVSITPRDFLNAALAAGECRSIREALQKKNIDTKVKSVLRNMKWALRNVSGSEGEQEVLWMKFNAMRIWNGCSVIFWTLNPHDIWSPLLVVFANGTSWQRERISLDWSDQEMQRFYAEHKSLDALAFQKLAAQDPGAAAKAVHQTFRMALEILFNVAPAASVKKNALFADGFACRCEPGFVGYVLSYLGGVEHQVRFTDYMHMFMQVLGLFTLVTSSGAGNS